MYNCIYLHYILTIKKIAPYKILSRLDHIYRFQATETLYVVELTEYWIDEKEIQSRMAKLWLLYIYIYTTSFSFFFNLQKC